MWLLWLGVAVLVLIVIVRLVRGGRNAPLDVNTEDPYALTAAEDGFAVELPARPEIRTGEPYPFDERAREPRSYLVMTRVATYAIHCTSSSIKDYADEEAIFKPYEKTIALRAAIISGKRGSYVNSFSADKAFLGIPAAEISYSQDRRRMNVYSIEFSKGEVHYEVTVGTPSPTDPNRAFEKLKETFRFLDSDNKDGA